MNYNHWLRSGIWSKVNSSIRSFGHLASNTLVCLTFIVFVLPVLTPATRLPEITTSGSAADVDRLLLQAAVSALKGRRGAVIVMDPKSGRIRAMVNSKMVFEEAMPPGSTIKPFTTLAALRSGVIDEKSEMTCQGKYTRGDFQIRCSHVKMRPPLDPRHALAYSCNYFYSKVGEALSEGPFNATLSSYGFGIRTGTGDEREATGSVPHGAWKVGNALGEGGEITVTPAQLITAYTALVNGGRLLVPLESKTDEIAGKVRATVQIEQSYRSLLIDGMRGAVTFGTAFKSGLGSLPGFLFGKTGTSTPQDDYHTDGWFVGFAADGESTPEPKDIKLAVLVFLKRQHGADAAEAAKTIFETYSMASSARFKEPEAIEPLISPEGTENASASDAPGTIRVRVVRHAVTRLLSLDDYVFGVIAAEGSTETEFEALKALAVTVRTFALKNRGRHGKDGFDFCDNTHCERFREVRDESSRPEFYQLVHRAVADTSGVVLSDSENHVAEAYFSAACGGTTANLGTLWGGRTPPYLRGIRDQYCLGSEYDHWSDPIPSGDLLKALRVDPRTDVGAYLGNVRVVKRDVSGRAETVELEGEHRKVVRGWDFKIIVGRTLGWNLIKSSKFEVQRAGSTYVFRGSGFGHGLGLCQLGAHTMATRGASYRDIVANYLPGTRLTDIGSISGNSKQSSASSYVPAANRVGDNSGARGNPAPVTARQFASDRTAHFAHATAGLNFPEQRASLRSENFSASYPQGTPRRDVEEALRTMEEARKDIGRRLTVASVDGKLPNLELFIHQTTGDFAGATGQPPWVSAVTHGRRIELQPLATLKRKGILSTTLRHEYVHAVIEGLGGSRTPRWLAEGMAAFAGGEGAMLSQVPTGRKLSVEELEKRLDQPTSPQEMRVLYAMAYREVAAIANREGEPTLWRRVAGR